MPYKAENWHALSHEKYFSKPRFLDICRCAVSTGTIFNFNHARSYLELVFYSYLLKGIEILFLYLQKETVYNTDKTADKTVKKRATILFPFP